MDPSRTLILVKNPELRERVTGLTRSLEWTSNLGLEFQTVEGDVSAAVGACRERAHNGPLGVFVDDQTEVLSALAAGADEAVVVASAEPFEPPTFSAFLDRLALRAQQRVETGRVNRGSADAEKLAALGTLVAGVGHEINNPLSVVMLLLEAARRRILPLLEVARDIGNLAHDSLPLPPEIVERLVERTRHDEGVPDAIGILDEMSTAVDSIALVVRDLRTFARTSDEDVPEVVEVQEMIEQSIRLAGGEIFPRGMLEQSFAHDLPRLVVPRNRVMQVLMNVLVNAGQAIREVERPLHRVRVSACADDEYVAITVSDTGMGIAPETIERIFDPFFTTKRQDMGTGLGLAISRSILRRLGGDITVDSVYGEGATFVCFLPIPSSEAVRAAWQRPSGRRLAVAARAPHPGRSVLLVESNGRVLHSYARLLHSDYRLIVAQDADEAIDLVDSGSAPDAVVVELDLPDAGGPRLIEWLMDHRPALEPRTIVVTSSGSDERFAGFLQHYRGAVLRKPVRGDQLLHAVENAFAADLGPEIHARARAATGDF